MTYPFWVVNPKRVNIARNVFSLEKSRHWLLSRGCDWFIFSAGVWLWTVEVSAGACCLSLLSLRMLRLGAAALAQVGKAEFHIVAMAVLFVLMVQSARQKKDVKRKNHDPLVFCFTRSLLFKRSNHF